MAPDHAWHPSFLSTGLSSWHQATFTAPALEAVLSSSLHITFVKFTNKRESMAIKPPQLPHATHAGMVPLPRVSHLAPLAPIRRLTSQWPRRPGQVREGALLAPKAELGSGRQICVPRLCWGRGHPHVIAGSLWRACRNTVTTTASQLPISSTACLWAGGRTSSTLLPSPVNIWHRVFQRIKLH